MSTFNSGILTTSDKGSKGDRINASGNYIVKMLKTSDIAVYPRAVKEYLDLILPAIPHAIDTLLGKSGDHN
jgi:molybdopterin biosynthesis enzyme MoaB